MIRKGRDAQVKRKWWIIVAAILAVLLIGLFCFRDALMVRLFPRVVLSNAIVERFGQLEERFENSPVHLLTDAMDPGGCQNISMRLDTETELMGIAHYSLDFQTQAAPNRIRGTGSVSTGAGMMDLSVYLDGDFMALSSESLTGGAYYGLTYDTFQEDIRRFQLLSALIGEDVLHGWEEALQEIQRFMSQSYVLPEVTPEDIQSALMGALALKPRVEAGEEKNTYAVSFGATGREIADAAAPYLDQVPESLSALVSAMSEDADSSLNVVFYLNRRQLTQVQASFSLSGSSYQITAELGQESASSPIALEVMSCVGEDLERLELTVKTTSDEEIYQEGIRLKHTRNGVQRQLTADYTWDLSTGDMVMDLVREGKKYPVRLNLTGEGECITLRTQEFEQLLSAITGKDTSRPAICTLTVSPGEALGDVPDYRNLSDWSFEDLMLLITRLGNLLGFKFA